MQLFNDRREAGLKLAQALAGFDLTDAVVIALPRGGVPVAAPIAARFGRPLDVLLIAKVGAPQQRELAVGAVTGSPAMHVTINEDIATDLGLSHADVIALAKRELPELERRRTLYCADHAPEPLSGRTVIIVDDGVATGATARAALDLVRQHGPRQIMLALPVAPRSTIAELATRVDEVVCLDRPEPFGSVGTHYGDFGQVGDRDVIDLLDHCRTAQAAAANDSKDNRIEQPID